MAGQSLPPRRRVNEQFSDIRPMRLVFGLPGNKLHGADNHALLIFNNENLSLASAHALGDIVPENIRFLPIEGGKKTDRRAAIDAVSQKITEFILSREKRLSAQ
ncbi:hypothetical protein SedNR2807_22900 [Citrobacter sedlakii]